MTTTNCFSIRRWWQITVDDLVGNAKKYAMMLGTFLGVILTLVLFTLYNRRGNYYWNWGGYPWYPDYYDPMWTSEQTIFLFGLFVFVCWSAGMMFSTLASKSSRISTLMFPAQQLEKYLSRFFIYIIIAPALYVIGIYVIDFIRVAVVKFFIVNNPCTHFIPLRKIIGDEAIEISALISGILVLQSFFTLGSSIWPKKPVVSTSLALFILLSFYTIVIMVLSEGLFRPDYSYGIELENEFKNSFIDRHDWIIPISIAFIVSAINYIIAYYRIKEIEIIQRW